MEQTITLMIVEDNKAYAKMLRDTVELSQGMESLGHFHSAEAFMNALNDPATQRPDVLLLDLNLPGENGLTMLPLIKKKSPETEVIILTQNNDYHTVLQAIHLGASGYLLKGGTIAIIRETIREVHAGSTYIDPQLSRMVLTALSHGDAPADNPLSPREMEVLELLAQGFSKKEVADQLTLSYHAIALYTRNIFKKLEAPNIAAAIATAIRQRLI
jgi:DNA-binding NarL/FixJ family response regulator